LDYALRIVKELKPNLFWRFLDVGCGMGGIVSGLRKLGFKAWGTEVSSFCLRFSPAKKWIRFGDICNLPFADKSFEAVICIDVLYYLTKAESYQAIKELTRITKYYLYIETVCRGSPNSSQRFNPDPLRKDKDLLTVKEVTNLFATKQAVFLKPLFTKEEDIDFNGFFVKI